MTFLRAHGRTIARRHEGPEHRRRIDGGLAGYNLEVAPKPREKPRGPWTAEEIARNERADRAQVAHDRARGVSANLEEAVALSRFANRFSEAFRHARRA
jgi:hypothetical protein